MTAWSRGLCCTVFTAALLLSSCLLQAQDTQEQTERTISRDSLLQIARTIIDSSSCSVLVTVDEQSRPRIREMDPFPPGKDWVIWLGTSPRSRKIQQIKHNAQVVVYYYDDEGLSYVSIAGRASIINDADLKKKYWRDYWKRFYPNPETDYVLIRVEPERMEIFSVEYAIFGDTATSEPVQLAF